MVGRVSTQLSHPQNPLLRPFLSHPWLCVLQNNQNNIGLWFVLEIGFILCHKHILSHCLVDSHKAVPNPVMASEDEGKSSCKPVPHPARCNRSVSKVEHKMSASHTGLYTPWGSWECSCWNRHFYCAVCTLSTKRCTVEEHVKTPIFTFIFTFYHTMVSAVLNHPICDNEVVSHIVAASYRVGIPPVILLCIKGGYTYIVWLQWTDK